MLKVHIDHVTHAATAAVITCTSMYVASAVFTISVITPTNAAICAAGGILTGRALRVILGYEENQKTSFLFDSLAFLTTLKVMQLSGLVLKMPSLIGCAKVAILLYAAKLISYLLIFGYTVAAFIGSLASLNPLSILADFLIP